MKTDPGRTRLSILQETVARCSGVGSCPVLFKMAAAAESISPATWVIRSIKADDDPFPESGLCDTTLMRSWESRWANDWPAARASQAPSIHDLLAIMQVRKAVQQSINVTDQYVSIHSYSESSVRSIDNTKSNYTDFPRRCLNIYIFSCLSCPRLISGGFCKPSSCERKLSDLPHQRHSNLRHKWGLRITHVVGSAHGEQGNRLS